MTIVVATHDLNLAASICRTLVLVREGCVLVQGATDAVRTERIAARVGWSHVAAVRHGHIYEIKSAYILQPGPAALTDRLRQLHDILARVRVQCGP